MHLWNKTKLNQLYTICANSFQTLFIELEYYQFPSNWTFPIGSHYALNAIDILQNIS